jgi:hypothetical protein
MDGTKHKRLSKITTKLSKMPQEKKKKNENKPRYDGRIYKWVKENDIKVESGVNYGFDDYKFLLEPLMDMHPKQVFYAKFYRADIIYTLPTWTDVENLVNDKMNRMIVNNPILQKYTKDQDTITQKVVADDDGSRNMIKFRGTMREKDAISVSSDLNVHDEYDASNMEIVGMFTSRLQASRNKDKVFGHNEWYFSHPSYPDIGVDRLWKMSDQKHWIIKCSHCDKKQFLSFPESFCMERRIYQCKDCKEEITDKDRRYGSWIARKGHDLSAERPYSGYWIPLMICPWVSAHEILNIYEDKSKTEEFFVTKVLGLPYRGSQNIVSREAIMKNVEDVTNDQGGGIVIGMDTGLTNYGVVGNDKGIFYKWGEKGYNTFEELLERFPGAVAVLDGQGDLQKPRELAEKYPGRIYFCYYREDRKSSDIIKFDEIKNNFVVDRNKAIQFLIDEFTIGGRIRLCGKDSDWEEYWQHWKALYKEVEENRLGVPVNRWKRSGDDHYVHATVYWRTGMHKFGGEAGGFVGAQNNKFNIKSSTTESGEMAIHAEFE